jgi:hypothetical protein
MARHLLSDDLGVANAMPSEVIAIKRGSHRGFATLAIKFTDTGLFGDGRFKEGYIWLIAIRMLQSRECGRLRLYEETSKLMGHNNTAQVIFADAVVSSYLKKGKSRVALQLMAHNKWQAASHS